MLRFYQEWGFCEHDVNDVPKTNEIMVTKNGQWFFNDFQSVSRSKKLIIVDGKIGVGFDTC